MIAENALDKSTDERLADIDTAVTTLTQMLRCLFDVVILKHRIDVFAKKTGQPLNELERSVADVDQNIKTAATFFFGAITVMSFAVALMALSQANQMAGLGVASVGLAFAALATSAFAVYYLRRARSRSTEITDRNTRMREDLMLAMNEAEALDDALAQALARLEAIDSPSAVSVCESDRAGAPEPQDS